MPWKTVFTMAAFAGLVFLPQAAEPLHAPFLSRLVPMHFDPHDLAAVWQFPMPKLPGAEAAPDVEMIRARRLALLAPKNLLDPQHELDHFYGALLGGGVTRIIHYGDSPTTGDLITADARSMFQKQFGDAGSGFVLIARPWAWYNHRGVEMDASNWKIDVAGVTEIRDGMHGLGGASFRGTTGAVAHWTLKDGQHRSLDVSYLAQPDAGSFVIEANGKEIGSADTAAPERSPGFASFDLPPGSKEFTLRVTKGAVRLFGADFRKKGPGVVYSSLGVNGANITLLSRAFNSAHWSAQLHHYKPDLVVLAYGTNESGYPQFVDSTWGTELKAAVKRVQAALPGTSILLMSPMDRGERQQSGEIDTVPALPRLVSIEARVAAETDVAFFNTFEAMGGQGTMARWYAAEPRLVGADFIHPMPAGAKIVGELLYNALRDGYNEYKLRKLNQPQPAAEKETQAGEESTSR